MSEQTVNPPADTSREAHDPLQGQVIRRNRRREAVLFLRNDALWVADFVDGNGEVVDAVTWVRFNCGAANSAHARRRMALEAAIPLSDELVERIEALQTGAWKSRQNE